MTHKPTLSADNGMQNAIYAQHELDVKTINNLKLHIRNLESQLEKNDSKMHYLKLDLANSQYDNIELNKKVNYLKTETEKLKLKSKDQEDVNKVDQYYIILLKILVVFLFLMNIFY
jgi:hypothetical protein